MRAGMLRCPNCGAGAAPESARCSYCNVRLQTVACPSCFGMMFVGAEHCSHCGAAAARSRDGARPAGESECPRCRPLKLGVTAVGEAIVEECARCGGLWLDAKSFQKIVDDREHQAAYVGLGAPSAVPHASVPEQRVRYVPCPVCKKIMNRVNFARCSGVIVDVCKGHGVWFDADELRQIVEFVRAGGLDASRAREREALEVERKRLEHARADAASSTGGAAHLDHEWRPAIHAAGDLLDWLLS
jgi:Zn-finger nucleic acid-binding protein